MAVALQKPFDVSGEFATLQFIFQQLAAGMATATLVQVLRCSNSGGLAAVGTVDVLPLVNQMTGDNTAMPHGKLVNLPYLRVQGGANAVILDPQPGDIGVAVFASRDISSVKAAKAAANPGSARLFSMADGLYLGGMLNGIPTQYVRFHSAGLELVSPQQVTIRAPEIVLDGHVAATGDIDADGDVTGEGTSLHTHTHGGVQSGGSQTDPPT